MQQEQESNKISEKETNEQTIASKLMDQYYQNLNAQSEVKTKIEFHVQGKKIPKKECSFESKKTIYHVYQFLKEQKDIWDILSRNSKNIMIYVNDKFVPAPNARLGDLIKSFSVGNQTELKLQVYQREIFG